MWPPELGSLPVQAARRGATAHAVDVSSTMLTSARQRAESAGVKVAVHHAGLLSYEYPAPVDVITCRSALHQLPDTWKQVALVRVADALRPGGTFYLWDAIWSFPAHETLTQLPAWIDRMAQPAGEGFTRADFETHVREEFSTFSWIIEGMIQRAGLTVEASSYPSPWKGEVIARKPREGPDA